MRVFCGNLPFSASDADIKKHFAACGKILFVRFAFDADGITPRGFCHIIFEDPPPGGDALRRALELDGSTLLERPISVASAPAQEKAKRPPKPQAPSKADAAPDEKEAKKKRLRPQDWRHDREAGLTLPKWKRKEQSEQAAGSGWGGGAGDSW